MADAGEAAPDFEAVYRELAAPVYRFCLSQLRNPAAAEDLAADVFAAAFAAYPRARPGADGVRPWVFRIARNAAIDRRRRAHTRNRLLAVFRPQAEPDAEAEAVLRDELRAVLAAMERLSERDRLAVGLRVAAGLSYAEVGRAMQLSEDAARMACTRALQKIRSELETR